MVTEKIIIFRTINVFTKEEKARTFKLDVQKTICIWGWNAVLKHGSLGKDTDSKFYLSCLRRSREFDTEFIYKVDGKDVSYFLEALPLVIPFVSPLYHVFVKYVHNRRYLVRDYITNLLDVPYSYEGYMLCSETNEIKEIHEF